jgi:hypothetical protein
MGQLRSLPVEETPELRRVIAAGRQIRLKEVTEKPLSVRR